MPHTTTEAAAEALREAAAEFDTYVDPNCLCGNCPNCTYSLAAARLRTRADQLHKPTITAVPAQRTAA